ncbi:MAG: PQQ-dependent sugar dehydrogenase [Phycisphaerae bacterium]
MPVRTQAAPGHHPFRRIVPVAALAALTALAALPVPPAVAVEPPLTTTLVCSGLTHPTYCTSPRGDFARLFVTEQPGRVRIVKNGVLLATPFLDVSTLPGFNSGTLEFGLLSLCFHPNYLSNGIFYVCYTANVGGPTADPILARFQVSANPDIANPAPTTILRVPYTLSNHRAAWMDFGPDGFLYYNTGDGGENDPLNAASDLTVLKGKVLRLDVNGPDGQPGSADDDGFPADPDKLYRIPAGNPFVGMPPAAPEIWAYGLRNPWRAGFDRLTGELYIGDVGQLAREEIDYQPAATGGSFYGWRCKEGTLTSGFAECAGALPPSIAPIFEYPHSGGTVISGSAVIGGYVYRGCAIPDLPGTYFFGDWGGQVVTFRYSPGGGITSLTNRTAELALTGTILSSFGEDALGELYVTRWGTGEVRKIVPAVAVGPDCNLNGRRDACDIAIGSSADANHDLIPDECQCLTCTGDTSGDNRADGTDVQAFVACVISGSVSGPGCRCADFNADSLVTVADVAPFVAKLLGDSDPACP